MSTKAWIIFAAVCVLLFGGLVIYSSRDNVDVSKVDTMSKQNASAGNGSIADHVDGNKNAKVVLLEYGDFQCPGCGAAHPKVKSIMEKYGDNVAFIFRNFPLTQIHPNARAAAASAEAAGLNGKYWQMHDLIFESQDQWSDASPEDRTSIFESYAEQIGLNKTKFTGSLQENNSDINKKINYDQSLGRKDGVSGTPTFYLNGEKMTDQQTGDEKAFETAITDALKKAGIDVSKKEKEE